MVEWLTPIVMLLTFLITMLGAAWSLSMWLSKQFQIIRDLVYDKMDRLQQTILNKLEYHERHDDERFASLNNDLAAIKIRNASRDSIAMELISDVNRMQRNEQTIAYKKESPL